MKTFLPPLSAKEEEYYLEQYHNGDRKARDILVERNMRLVAHMVKKYVYSEYDSEDLISIGTIGLIKAVNTFDEKKGSRLATYAAKCIDNELLMTFRNDKKRNRDVSFNEPFGTDKEGNEICFKDIAFLEDEDVILRMQKNQDIKRLIEIFDSTLNSRERFIIIRRYGLGGCKSLTQREIASKYGISRSYVSRIEKRALEKLRVRMI